MKKAQAAFIITAAAMSLLTLYLSWGICDMIYEPEEVFPKTEGFYADGTDLTGLINAGISVSNSVVSFISVIITLICFFTVITVASPVVWAVFGSILRKKRPVGSEFPHRGFLPAIVTAAAVLTMDIVFSLLAGNGFCFLNLLFVWQSPLFMWLLLRKKRS